MTPTTSRKPHWLALWLLLVALPSGAAQAFSEDKLTALAEPIALYPDVLIAQILPASTNPVHIIDAARFLQKAGGEVSEPPEGHDWHPSVVALLGVPPVLNMMNEQLSWTLELGEAVKNQRTELMDAIQAARQEAKEAGKLETSEQQVVVVEKVVEKEVIKIQPADPQVIYVPQYYPTYPTTSSTVVYQDNSDEAAFVGLTVGLLLGAAIVNADYGYVRWGRYGFYYDNDFYEDFLEDRYEYARDLQQRRFDQAEKLQQNRQDFIEDRQDTIGDRRDDRQETISDRRDEIGDRRGDRQDKIGDQRSDRQDRIGERQTPRRDESATKRIQRDDARSRAAAERLERATGGSSVQRRTDAGDRVARTQTQRQSRPTTTTSQRPAVQSRSVSRNQTSPRTSAGTSTRRAPASTRPATGSASRRSLGGSGTYSRQSAFGGSGFQGGSTRSFSQRGGRSLGGRASRGRR